MRMFVEQHKAMQGLLPQSPIIFAEIVAIDEEGRRLKIITQDGMETGWCRCLMDTFYPIPTHMPHMDPDAPLDSVAAPPEFPPPINWHKHSPHLPKWPYKVGQEVLAAVVRGSQDSEQYVVLGLIDKGPLAVEDEPELLEFET